MQHFRHFYHVLYIQNIHTYFIDTENQRRGLTKVRFVFRGPSAQRFNPQRNPGKGLGDTAKKYHIVTFYYNVFLRHTIINNNIQTY